MSEPSNLVTVTQKRIQCRHLHAARNQCGSPALRHEQFCHFHHTTRRPKPPAGKLRFFDAEEPFELPIVEDLPSALSVAAQLLSRIASNDLDPQRAGKLLYNLQIITSIIDKSARAAAKAGPIAKPEPVAELVADEAHGLIAPITEYVPAPPALGPDTEYIVDPPPPVRDLTPEEVDYFKHTSSFRGYEPNSQYPRPASITDEDILAYTSKNRRAWCFPPLKARKDGAGRLISIHEQGASHTIPAIVPQPGTENPQPVTIPTLQAMAPFSRPEPHEVPSKTARTAARPTRSVQDRTNFIPTLPAAAHHQPRPTPLRHLRCIRKNRRAQLKQLRSAAGWRAERSCFQA